MRSELERLLWAELHQFTNRHKRPKADIGLVEPDELDSFGGDKKGNSLQSLKQDCCVSILTVRSFTFMSSPPLYQDKWQELASTIVSPMSSPDTLAPHVDKWLTPKDSTKITEVLIAEIRNEYSLNIATEVGFDSKRKNQAVVAEIKVRFVEK